MSLQKAKVLFVELLGNVPAERWDARLAELADGDEELRQSVNQLLAAHRDAASFLESPARSLGQSIKVPGSERAGAVIGPYKLIEQIGEGGMATVWMAQQTEPVKRLVAVKLIKAGMDSKQVLARFDAERQALALMDHPNIARVLDGGTTGAGRPYFVMDLVKGIPITKYCDDHHLAPQQRLELLIPVCHAIQHAHQKGIIHRDLKPTNVLVALYDGNPVPKVIDFGVAKAAGQQLTERTLVTSFGSIVGTLDYMSPEQANFNQLDVDTRSDVYSLGVLLYELLTGSPPHSQKETEAAGLIETLRVIREHVPAKPSTKLSTAAGLPTLAANRGTEPAKLTRLMRGELDWIVMKALEKDRNRRYETVNGLAMDLQSYLADEPVQACPPSAAYRLRRFVRKNKRAVLAVGAIFLLLVAGIAGTTWGLVRAERAWQEESRQRQLAEAAAAAEAAERGRAQTALAKAAREAAVSAAINDFLNNDLLQLASPMGQAYVGVSPDANLKLRTVLQRAAKRIDGKFPNEPEVEMRLRYTLGYTLQSVGDFAGALAQYEKVVSYSRELRGRDDAYTLKAEYRVATIHRHLGHRELAVTLLEQNVERDKAILGLEHPQTFMAMNGLAMTYHVAGQKDKALQVAEETLELRKRHLAPTDLDIFVSTSNLGWIHLQQKQVDKALPLLEEASAGLRANFPPLHPERLMTSQILAQAYHAAEQLDKALPLQETVTGQYRTAFGAEDRLTQSCLDNLIGYLVDVAACDKAQALLPSIQVSDDIGSASAKQRQDARTKRHHELIEAVRPSAERYQHELAEKKADHPDTLAARQAYAVALRDHQRLSAAAYHLKAVFEARQRLFGPDHPDTLASRLELAATRLHQKRYAEAVQVFVGWNKTGVRSQGSEVRGDKSLP